jgi:hypothetical protein
MANREPDASFCRFDMPDGVERVLQRREDARRTQDKRHPAHDLSDDPLMRLGEVRCHEVANGIGGLAAGARLNLAQQLRFHIAVRMR